MANPLRSPFEKGLQGKTPGRKGVDGKYDQHEASSVNKPGSEKILPEKFYEDAASLKPKKGGSSAVRTPMDGPHK